MGFSVGLGRRELLEVGSGRCSLQQGDGKQFGDRAAVVDERMSEDFIEGRSLRRVLLQDQLDECFRGFGNRSVVWEGVLTCFDTAVGFLDFRSFKRRLITKL